LQAPKSEQKIQTDCITGNRKIYIMKKLNYKIVLPFVAAFVFVSLLSAQEYKIVNDISSVKWQGSKIVKGEHAGTINIKEGSVRLKDGILLGGSIIIDMHTISGSDLKGSSKERLEKHLKSDDFFGVDKFPESRFELLNSKESGNSGFLVTGNLTIKGKTHPIEFNLVQGKKDDNITLSGRMSIDRSIYDVRYGSGKFFDNLGDKAINDIFTLDFMLYLIE